MRQAHRQNFGISVTVGKGLEISILLFLFRLSHFQRVLDRNEGNGENCPRISLDRETTLKSSILPRGVWQRDTHGVEPSREFVAEKGMKRFDDDGRRGLEGGAGGKEAPLFARLFAQPRRRFRFRVGRSGIARQPIQDVCRKIEI